jgi:hypothetical protein
MTDFVLPEIFQIRSQELRSLLPSTSSRPKLQLQRLQQFEDGISIGP